MNKDKERVPYLKGERVSLYILTPDDTLALCQMINQEEMKECLSTYVPIMTNEEREWLEALPGHTPHDFVFEIILNEGGSFIGNIGLYRVNQVDRTATVGLFISDQTNREYDMGREAGEIIKRFAFETLNLRKLRYDVLAHNERSLKLGQDLGGHEEGRLVKEYFINDRYVDLVILAIFRQDEKE